MAGLLHALYEDRSEQSGTEKRHLTFKDPQTAVAEAEAARVALTARNAGGTAGRLAAKRNRIHLPDHMQRIELAIEPTPKVDTRPYRHRQDRRGP